MLPNAFHSFDWNGLIKYSLGTWPGNCTQCFQNSVWSNPQFSSRLHKITISFCHEAYSGKDEVCVHACMHECEWAVYVYINIHIYLIFMTVYRLTSHWWERHGDLQEHPALCAQSATLGVRHICIVLSARQTQVSPYYAFLVNSTFPWSISPKGLHRDYKKICFTG